MLLVSLDGILAGKLCMAYHRSHGINGHICECEEGKTVASNIQFLQIIRV